MALPKEYSNFPVTDPKELENCDLPNKEFKIVVLRKFSELQGNTETQFNNIRKTILEQSGKFKREIGIIKKNQVEILEMKNVMNEMQNTIKSINSRLDQAEKICKVEDRSFKIIQRRTREK